MVKHAIATAVATAVLLTACESTTEPRIPTLEELVGTYAATAAVFTATADAGSSYDVLAEGGRYTLQIHPGGQYTTTLERPGRNHLVRTGTLALNGPRLELTEGGQTRLVEFELDGDVLAWHDPGDRFDFGDGTVPAQLVATLAR